MIYPVTNRIQSGCVCVTMWTQPPLIWVFIYFIQIRFKCSLDKNKNDKKSAFKIESNCTKRKKDRKTSIRWPAQHHLSIAIELQRRDFEPFTNAFGEKKPRFQRYQQFFSPPVQFRTHINYDTNDGRLCKMYTVEQVVHFRNEVLWFTGNYANHLLFIFDNECDLGLGKKIYMRELIIANVVWCEERPAATMCVALW